VAFIRGRGFVGPAAGHLIFFVSGRAARRAGVAAHAQARQAGRAGPGMVVSGSCRVWAGSKCVPSGGPPCFGPNAHL
jgi:hypothetical protein